MKLLTYEEALRIAEQELDEETPEEAAAWARLWRQANREELTRLVNQKLRAKGVDLEIR